MLIGELAKRSRLSKDTIRHYESLGLLHSQPMQAGSRTYRDYDDTSLERLAMIAFAKSMHISLREMAEPFNRALSNTSTRAERSQLFIDKITELDKKMAQLKSTRKELVSLAQTPDKDYAQSRLKQLGYWLE